MEYQIAETDWIVLRQLRPIAVERFSARVIDEIHQMTSSSGRSAHDRFTDVRELIQRRTREMADAFDDVRRSNAYLRLRAIQSLDLLTAAELERFSPELREMLRLLSD